MLPLSFLPLLSLVPVLVQGAATYDWPKREDLGKHQLEDRAFKLYTTVGTSTATGWAAASSQTGAHSQMILTAPDPPGDTPQVVTRQLWESADALTDPARGNSLLSVKQRGNFLGYSVELSVANQILGPSSTELRAPFLNFLQNLRARTLSGPRIRIGGNSQEGSIMYPTDGLPNGGAGGSFIEKAESTATITNTPDVLYTEDMIYAMGNVTALVGTEWLMGLAFANSTLEGQYNAMKVAVFVEEVLGDALLGYQIGNEPDLYPGRRRTDSYYIPDWYNEIGAFLQSELIVDPDLKNANNFFLPNVCCNWSPQQMIDTGFLDTYGPRMNTLSFQHYPDNNCGKPEGTAQAIFQDYLNHTASLTLVDVYIGPANLGIQYGLDVGMIETNTASCSGFEGLSDSFGSALWALDWSLTLAYRNFTSSLLHVGGRDAYYNPFTAVQTNQSSFRGWTVGPVYYSTLAMAEVLGASNTSQVVDISDQDNIYYPSYAIYENNAPAKVALFNFISDGSGNSDYNAQISVGGISVNDQPAGASSTPSEVYVRYLYSETRSVSEMYAITWANQTAALGGDHSSDGTLYGTQETVTIQCENQVCSIPMQAPSFAIVFLTQEALDQSSGILTAETSADGTATTFGTTYALGGVGTATVDQQVLATSNGRSGASYGSTSEGSTESAKEESLRQAALEAGALPTSYPFHTFSLAAVGLATAWLLRGL